MKLDDLKRSALCYINGDVREDMFHTDILDYLADATSEDYTAFALWLLNEDEKVH